MNKKILHPLLQKQLEQNINYDKITPGLEAFINIINDTYINQKVNDAGRWNSSDEINSEQNAPFEISHQMLLNILDLMPSPLIIKDSNHKVIFVNDAYCDLVKTERSIIINNIETNFLGEEVGEFVIKYDELFFNKQNRPINELIFTNKNQEDIKLKVRRINFKTDTGVYMLKIIDDITEAKMAEQEIMDFQHKLEESLTKLERKNNELDQFAYIVSHDLKAPLRAISNLVTWIEEDNEESLNEETKLNYKLLKDRVVRMEQLINGVLQYTKAGRGSGVKEQVHLPSFIAEVCDMLSVRNIVDISEEMPVILTEKLYLEQVLSNLISNSVKHNTNSQTLIKIYGEDEIGFIKICIEDNGPGVPKEFHEKIFQIFHTLKPKDTLDTTGVGLSIVKKIVEDKGGKVWLDADFIDGARFCFIWPKS